MGKFIPGLAKNAASVTITLASGAGQAPIPDSAGKVGILTSSSMIRIGLDLLNVSGSASGSVLSTDFQNGIPISPSSIRGVDWFMLGAGFSRILYIRGGTSDVVTVIYV